MDMRKKDMAIPKQCRFINLFDGNFDELQYLMINMIPKNENIQIAWRKGKKCCNKIPAMNGSSMRKNGASSIGRKEFFMLFLYRAVFTIYTGVQEMTNKELCVSNMDQNEINKECC